MWFSQCAIGTKKPLKIVKCQESPFISGHVRRVLTKLLATNAAVQYGLPVAPLRRQTGNWWCHLFFPRRNWRHFLVIALCKVMTFFSCRLTISTYRRRLSSVLSKFSHKNFRQVSRPGWCQSPGAVPPVITPLRPTLWLLLFVARGFV